MRPIRFMGILLLFMGLAAGRAHATLNPTPVLTLDGSVDFQELGWVVATAGDVNGDGYSDILVGQPRYASLLGSNVGRVRLYLGGANGPNSLADWSEPGGTAGMQFGYSVAAAGDVNGDGYDDVLVGAPYYDNGQNNEGSVYLYYGSAAGLATAPAWSYQSNSTGASLGYCVATAGDVNADGFDDMVIGAPGFTNTLAAQGRVFIFHGRATVPLSTPARTLDGALSQDNFGSSVSTAGDITADGYADILVGAPYQNVFLGATNAGAAYCFYGGAAGVDAASDWLFQGGQVDEFLGGSVALAGDTNGDGYSDIIVGSVGYDGAQAGAGRARVFLGGSAGLAASAVRTYSGTQLNEAFGNCVATAGDINGDGYADILVGAPNSDQGQVDEGIFYAYYGGPVGPATVFSSAIDMDVTTSGLGHSVQTAGDVNGDGFSDVIAGAPFIANGGFSRGRALVYLGGGDGFDFDEGFSSEANQASAQLGTDLGYADVNGDGYSDLLAGAPDYQGAFPGSGRVNCFFGGPSGVSNPADWRPDGPLANMHFGWAIDGAGDVNGDGYDDVLVGAPAQPAFTSDPGRAYLYSGSPAGPGATAAWSASGSRVDGEFGYAVAGAGDVNGDGYADVVIGEPGHGTSLLNEGAALLYLGSAAGLGSPAMTWPSGQAGARGGLAVAGAGDINGDGYSDVVVGVPFYDRGQLDEGAIYVYFGGPPPYSPTPSQIIERNGVGATFGWSVSSAGDVNNDGYADVVVGAPTWSNGQANEGSVAVYLGSPTGLSGSPVFTYELNSVGMKLGSSVAACGDVDSDGYSEFAVGAPGYNSNTGRIFVFGGSAGGVISAPPFFFNDGPATFSDYGAALAGAGDVDGDGYPDLAVGIAGYDNGQANEGKVSLRYGNRHSTQFDVPGLEILPLQRRSGGTVPLPLLGMSDSETTIQFGRYLRSPLGRCRVRFDWAIEPLGTGFPVTNTSPQWYDSGPSAGIGAGSRVTFLGVASNLDPGTAYHWRGRTRSHTPFFPRSPWISFAGNSALETDFRTRPSVSGVVDGGTQAGGLRMSAPLRAGNGPTTFRFALPDAAHARLTLHDVAGRLVATLVDTDLSAGEQQVAWDGRSTHGTPLVAGVYFARLAAGDAVARARVVVTHP